MRLHELLEDISRRGFIGGAAAALAGAGQTDVAQAARPPNTFVSHDYPRKRYVPNSQLIQGWRADEKAGRGIETQPTNFDRVWVTEILASVARARQAKLIAPISAEEFLAVLLTEGRSDFGFDGKADTQPWKQGQNPWIKFREMVKAAGVKNDSWANFITLMRAKQNKAQKQGTIFYQAWQGSPRFNRRFQLNLAAAKHPKNAELLKLFKQYLP